MSNKSANDPGGYIELRIEEDQLTFVTSIDRDLNQNALYQYNVSSLSSVRNVLTQDRLTGAALENAITQVEDLIMPIIRNLPESTELKISGSEFEHVFHMLPVTNGEGAPIELVESLYRQLADYSVGSPIAWRHASSPEQAAVGLVALREVMHHSGFRFVSLLPVME
jgi:hypothetical protein